MTTSDDSQPPRATRSVNKNSSLKRRLFFLYCCCLSWPTPKEESMAHNHYEACTRRCKEKRSERAFSPSPFFPSSYPLLLVNELNEWKNIFQFKSTTESNWTWRMFIARHTKKLNSNKVILKKVQSRVKLSRVTRRQKICLWKRIKVKRVMAPIMGLNNSNGNGQGGDSPLSKTYQYRKIMKPMLERKRRARINRCLDELKELITGALQNVSWSFTKSRRVFAIVICHLIISRTELP